MTAASVLSPCPSAFFTGGRYSQSALLDEPFEGVLAAAKTGGERAFAALYRHFQPNLVRFLRAQAPAQGDDLASEVWLDAAQGLHRFDGDEAAFRGWLFTIARRRLIDFRRREQRRRRVSVSLAAAGEDPAGDPEARAFMGSDSEVALARIGRLPPEQAEVVLLRVLVGLDTAEVAALVGKTSGAVRVLQHRALQRLSDELIRERRKVDVTE